MPAAERDAALVVVLSARLLERMEAAPGWAAFVAADHRALAHVWAGRAFVAARSAVPPLAVTTVAEGDRVFDGLARVYARFCEFSGAGLIA